jgi:hypothetical protein
VTRVQTAGAGDPFRLEPAARLAEFDHTGQMCAVSASASHQLAVPVEQQRHVSHLRHRNQRLGAVG